MDGQGLSNVMGWVYAFASATGTSHIKAGVECQDNCTCEVVNSKANEEIIIVIASDGAGSADWGSAGSRLICSIVKQEINNFLDKGFSIRDITRETAAEWIEKFRQDVSHIAEDSGRTIRDYACTLVAALVGLHEEVYFQIGDGAIVVLPRYYSKGYRCIFWPERGEYENTTFFATDKNALDKHLKFKMGESEGDEIANIAVFTDGIQSLALHYESKTPFAGFFEPMFKGLKAL
jgi:hypothetical protein